MQDKTITNALLQLRAQIIRGGLDGLGHVEVLLLARGVDLAGHYVARPYQQRRGRNYVRLIIIGALRKGPMTGREISDIAVETVPDAPTKALRAMTYSALSKMGKAGLVVRGGGMWRLAQPNLLRKMHI